MESKSLILDHSQVMQRIERMAWQILELAHGQGDLVIAGIVDSGYVLAEMLGQQIERISQVNYELAKVDIDKERPMQSEVQISLPRASLEGKWVVLVDDVLNTGGTLAYSLVPFLQVPVRGLTMAVLVDREHHRYPIWADIQGLSLSTTMRERIEVQLAPDDCAVYLS